MQVTTNYEARRYDHVIREKPSMKEIEDRVLKVVAAYDKVTADKVNIPDYHSHVPYAFSELSGPMRQAGAPVQ